MGALLVAAAAGGCVGLVIGAALMGWLGERGRRRDVQWYAGLSARPAEPEVEVQPSDEGERDARALHRAELEALEAGLAADIRANGGRATAQEIHDEAVRLLGVFEEDPV